MSYSSVADSSSTSPWEALQDSRNKHDGSSSDGSVFAVSFPPPPPPPPTTTDASTTDAGTSDAGTSDASTTASTNDPANLDGALAQLIAGLQSFLLNLQANVGTDSTASTGTGDTSTEAASTATTSTAAPASTASTAATPSTSDLFADLSTVLGDLQASFADQTPGQDPGLDAYTGSSTTTTDATDTALITNPGGPPHGYHDLLADLLNAVQSYAAQPTPTGTLATTTSLTA